MKAAKKPTKKAARDSFMAMGTVLAIISHDVADAGMWRTFRLLQSAQETFQTEAWDILKPKPRKKGKKK